jgi:leader peptidase (prepilin peptidase)/N-methyltransferase
MVGSFLNVCIHRMPLGQSIVSPPSHCPHCHYAIPWYLNIPLVTWIYLRARCRNCGAPISARYFLVELLAALLFLACWLSFGPHSAALALIYSFFLAALVAATFIDLEHFIIPDEIHPRRRGGRLRVSFAGFPRCHWSERGRRDEGQVLGMSVARALVYSHPALSARFSLAGKRLELKGETGSCSRRSAPGSADRSFPYDDIFYGIRTSIGLPCARVEMVTVLPGEYGGLSPPCCGLARISSTRSRCPIGSVLQ